MPHGRDLILKALDSLNEDEFKRFKNKLLTVPLPDGFCHVSRRTLQALDHVDLTDKIVSYCLEGYGLKVTVQVLQDIGMREEAVTPQQAAGTVRLCAGWEEHFWEAPSRTIYIMDQG